MRAFLFLLCVASLWGQEKEFEINLKDPVFSHGVIMTDQGGVVTAEGMRVQAQKIEYTDRIENGKAVKRVVAEGDLLMQYGDRVFVGRKLEYDFATKNGVLWDGRTFVDIWYLGGERIELNADRSYLIYNGTITTCESQENNWEVNAGLVRITKNRLLSARNIRFHFFKIPVFWLPSFKSNLRIRTDAPVRYKILWDKGIGPRASIRYKAYSLEDFALFLRLDYRLKMGVGGAVETKYKAPKTLFLTRSYAAHDKSWPDERGNKRFRLQGLYDHTSKDERTYIHMTYDRMSDDKMPGDFKSSDFEINTQKRTILLMNHREDSAFFNFVFQPRINRFQSLNQELPSVTIGFHPFEFGRTKIIAENKVDAGFLDYVFNKRLHEFLHNRHALRLETKNSLYWAIPIKHFTLTPSAGIVGIFYNNNPDRTSIGQLIFTYGLTTKTRLYRSYSGFQHILEPYLDYQGLSQPKAKVDDVFIFNIDDGYAELNQLRVGIRNLFWTRKDPLFAPSFMWDLYAMGLFEAKSFHQTIPKLYSNVGWNRPSFAINAGIAWNLQENLLDYSNIRTDFTFSENFALGAEFRHRSRFDFRKADHENFILDIARPLSELVDSPLSDGRNTLLTRLFARLSPRLSLHIESHSGWGRKNEPRYDALKVSLFTMITSSWQLKLGYQYTPNDIYRFTGAVSIIK